MNNDPIPLRILVLDDDRHTREYLKKGLEALGHRVVTPEGGIATLCRAMDEEFDLLIIAYLMKYELGAEVVRLLRAMEKGRDLPVLMLLTKSADAEANRKMYEWNDTNVIGKLRKHFSLLKPFSLRELTALITQFSVRQSSD